MLLERICLHTLIVQMGDQMQPLRIPSSLASSGSNSWLAYLRAFPTVSAATDSSYSMANNIAVPSDANGEYHELAAIFPMVMPFQFVPTINGYKRLSGGEAFWAPNAVTYGYDSRAAAVRIISAPSAPPAATRFEIRVPGADMNPYFVLSAIFKLGLRGIEQGMKLTIPPISTYLDDPSRRGEAR